VARARRGREDDPVTVGAVLADLVGRRGWAERMAVGRLRAAWPEVVGAQIATRSEPTRLEDGVLHVRTDGGAWATELTLLSATIAQKASAFLGGDVVREVRVAGSGGGSKAGRSRGRDET
jgi:predicted nucleic acid-binding Zn ribbon protein